MIIPRPRKRCFSAATVLVAGTVVVVTVIFLRTPFTLPLSRWLPRASDYLDSSSAQSLPRRGKGRSEDILTKTTVDQQETDRRLRGDGDEGGGAGGGGGSGKGKEEDDKSEEGEIILAVKDKQQTDRETLRTREEGGRRGKGEKEEEEDKSEEGRGKDIITRKDEQQGKGGTRGDEGEGRAKEEKEKEKPEEGHREDIVRGKDEQEEDGERKRDEGGGGGGRGKGKKNDNKGKDSCEKSRRDDVIHVVTSGDQNTYAAMVTLATSVVVNTRSRVMLHFITFDTQAANLSSILKSSILHNTSYEIIPFSKDTLKGQFVVRSPRQKDLANPLNFVRFYLPDLLPCVDHVAYIDVDCLVIGDIKKLYTWPIKDKDVVAGLPEPNKLAGVVINFGNPYIKENSTIKKTSVIMSAGVFVANLTRWRDQNITGLLDYWMKLNVRSDVVRYSGNGSGSQAIMLLALHDKYSPLDESWNKLYEYQSKNERHSKRTNLLHWNGPKKPWKSKVKNADLWMEYFLRANSTISIS